MSTRDLLKKHEFAIQCAIKYYVKNEPTGISDSDYDKLEKAANEDGLDIRSIALSRIRGNRIRNRYIEPIPKVYAEESMYDAIYSLWIEYGKTDDIYAEPKYDGSSIAVYYEDGIPCQVVTCGGSNKSSDEGGIDQTEKLQRYFPPLSEEIKALQCEVLVDMNYCDKPRQLANGILNSKNKYSDDELDDMIRIRAFRYFSDSKYDFMRTIKSIKGVANISGFYNFAPGYVMTIKELLDKGKDVVDREYIVSPSGNFLIDGYVFYSKEGDVIKAIKFKNAGGQESIEVEKIQWNDLSDSKDGFSANVILKDPVEIRGSMIKKPSSNGVNNLLKNNITPGAMVSVTLRGSTIPCVDKVFKPGNGDFNWPVCKCGTQLGADNIFGNNIKCPNINCSSRKNRMKNYVNSGRFTWSNVDCLDGYFIIDRFSFSKKVGNKELFMSDLRELIYNDKGIDELRDMIYSLGLTRLQMRNLELVLRPSYEVLREFINNEHIFKIS